MAKKKSGRIVTINYKIVLDVGVEVGNLSLEDALVKGRQTKVEDLIDFTGLNHNDSEIRVSWLSESEED